MTAAGRVVVVPGATGAAGRAVASALTRAGARVVAVGTDAGRLAGVDAEVREVCDLGDFDATLRLAEKVAVTVGRVDGLIHLVGGWRGGGGLAGQTDDDWEFLQGRILGTLRNTTRAFDEDLRASDAGRLAVVSSTAVQRPYPGGANYSTAKLAAETWARAVDRGFSKSGSPARTTIFVVSTLNGLEGALAERVVDLWESLPPERVLLEPTR
ncbi:SDR family NAD(P)-dependent oxidoreductase [Planctomonas psychrotolerans]|uniref:SDR family NAD(P)-dependent oxidoreductase n=1 Tax=Planctomonas psychrotolerans TaxID=2528712 RepID=UPI00123973FD|nr:SDR family oxidoreductase [Planctomonas psychrotolerans]